MSFFSQYIDIFIKSNKNEAPKQQIPKMKAFHFDYVEWAFSDISPFILGMCKISAFFLSNLIMPDWM